MKKKKALLLAVVLGVVVVILINIYMTDLEKKYIAKGERIDVLVAREYIPPNVILTPALVKIDKVPRPYHQPTALSSHRDLTDEVGQFVYMTVVPIMLEEQIMTSKLVEVGRETGVAVVLPPGKRAVTINVNYEKGVGMLIVPGNNVDVLGTFEYEVQKKGRRESRTHTKVLLQNVPVVAVRDSVLGEFEFEEGASGRFGVSRRVSRRVPDTITLAVSPKEAVLLTFARVRGDISFSLRALGDEEKIEIKNITYKDLFPKVKEKVVFVGPKQERPVSVIRGMK